MPEAEGMTDRAGHAQQILAVCNACRYCEQFCPVFPAIERRAAFTPVDLHYLANLCHNCGECLYACQYAPPHPFGVNLPRALAEARLTTYRDYAWPAPLGALVERHGAATALGLSAACALVLGAAVWTVDPSALWRPAGSADFYAVVPHGVLVGLFGAAAGYAVLALAMSLRRFWRDVRSDAVRSDPRPVAVATWRHALAEGLSLRHLHGGGTDCTSSLDVRRPWRRWAHHATLGGFALCLASTTVAAVYHIAFGWVAPHAYLSVPVVLGVLGGAGLIVGPSAFLAQRLRRDPALGDPAQQGLDTSFLTLLLVTSVTGLALLGWREDTRMGPLLVVHLGAVLAFFLTMPYSKFVHGFYRLLALVWAAHEASR